MRLIGLAVVLILGIALAPIAGYSQTSPKAARVGLLMTTTPLAASHIVVAFADGLRERGHLEVIE